MGCPAFRTSRCFSRMTQTILSSRLTTCDAEDDGTAIHLDFLDAAGEPVAVTFPFVQAQSIVVMLPGLLSQALRRKIKSDVARLVFDLGRWSVERSDRPCAIMTLATEDGFEVSFGIPFEACRSLGWALRHESKTAGTVAGRAGGAPLI